MSIYEQFPSQSDKLLGDIEVLYGPEKRVLAQEYLQGQSEITPVDVSAAFNALFFETARHVAPEVFTDIPEKSPLTFSQLSSEMFPEDYALVAQLPVRLAEAAGNFLHDAAECYSVDEYQFLRTALKRAIESGDLNANADLVGEYLEQLKRALPALVF